MNKKIERKDFLELFLSILGFITCIIVYALTNLTERYFFFFTGILLGMNIIHQLSRMEKERINKRILKYSKKGISEKCLKKVSY